MRRAVILDFQMGIRDKSPYARAILVLDWKYYLFDMTQLTAMTRYQPGITECMAFKCDKKGKVKSWSETYVRQNHLGVNRKNLMECIMDFCDLADFEK
jgi:hypothetical protein|nr:MAG TPA: hypothetical protein [Caudoviricetes sp.]